MTVVTEVVFEPLDAERHIGIESQAEVDHAGMGLSMSEDEIAEIAIVGNEQTIVGPSVGENVTIRQARRIFPADADYIVSLRM